MNATRFTLGLLVSLVLLSGEVTGEEVGQQTAFKNPRDVFRAYQRAKNEQSWDDLFALYTDVNKDCQLADQMILLATNDQHPATANLAKLYQAHGIDWQAFKNGLSKFIAPSEEQDETASENQLGELFRKTLKGTTEKQKLFVAVQKLIIQSSLIKSSTVVELQELTIEGSTATGLAFEKREIEETNYGTDGKPFSRKREVREQHRLLFRKSEGRWYLDAFDESKQSIGLP